MKRSALFLAVAVVTSAITTVVPAAAATSAPGRHVAHVCGLPSPGRAACLNQVMLNAAGRPAAARGPSGLNPADIRGAYALTGAASAGRTVAVIDAYNAPTAESDLGVYRRQFGLSSCTTANGCFRKVNQRGGSSMPQTDAGWATEISLDVDMVSAACPDCRILLVEADSPSFADLGAAVNLAARQPGVVAISNSYGVDDTGPRAAYDHPGIAITASSGDYGYGIGAPASYRTVVAVGGTSLTRAGSARGWSETAWSGSGSGCSTVNAKPSWQTSATQCSGKATADVSAVADPRTGVSVYNSTPYQGVSGWQVYGGTSASAPIIAGVFALSGRTAGYPASYLWTHAAGLNDVTTGANGNCRTSVWCHAGPGWDGPTGLGTPRGTTAF